MISGSRFFNLSRAQQFQKARPINNLNSAAQKFAIRFAIPDRFKIYFGSEDNQARVYPTTARASWTQYRPGLLKSSINKSIEIAQRIGKASAFFQRIEDYSFMNDTCFFDPCENPGQQDMSLADFFKSHQSETSEDNDSSRVGLYSGSLNEDGVKYEVFGYSYRDDSGLYHPHGPTIIEIEPNQPYKYLIADYDCNEKGNELKSVITLGSEWSDQGSRYLNHDDEQSARDESLLPISILHAAKKAYEGSQNHALELFKEPEPEPLSLFKELFINGNNGELQRLVPKGPFSLENHNMRIQAIAYIAEKLVSEKKLEEIESDRFLDPDNVLGFLPEELRDDELAKTMANAYASNTKEAIEAAENALLNEMLRKKKMSQQSALDLAAGSRGLLFANKHRSYYRQIQEPEAEAKSPPRLFRGEVGDMNYFAVARKKGKEIIPSMISFADERGRPLYFVEFKEEDGIPSVDKVVSIDTNIDGETKMATQYNQPGAKISGVPADYSMINILECFRKAYRQAA